MFYGYAAVVKTEISSIIISGEILSNDSLSDEQLKENTMKWLTLTLLPFCGLAFALTGCSSGPDMKEGKWEISTEMGMKGIPVKMPAISFSQCLSKKDIIPRNQEQAQSNCSVTERKTDGDTVSWKLVCKNGATETISDGMITYSGVLFSGKIDITMSGGPIAMTATNTITGKYLGPCD